MHVVVGFIKIYRVVVVSYIILNNICGDNPHAASRPRGRAPAARRDKNKIISHNDNIILLYNINYNNFIHNDNYYGARECPHTSDLGGYSPWDLNKANVSVIIV